jgi:hypothetical protein
VLAIISISKNTNHERESMKYLVIFSTLFLSACVTTSGTYTLSAIDATGKSINNQSLMASGRGIYTVRNALCNNHPGATIIIKDINTGKALSSESPYQCR